jgi:uroporphyrinogen-III decarboxylase
MNSIERVRASLSHNEPDRIPIDLGATAVTGIHVSIVEKLREYYGLEKRPIKIFDLYQMLGEVDEELMDIMGIDIVGITPRNNMFGFPNENWREFKTHWGQVVLVPEKFITSYDEEGALLVYPEGDNSVPPSARMPKASFFFDSIIRQEPLVEEELNPEDNLEEFKYLSEEDINYFKQSLIKAKKTNRAIIANIGGTALGDIALVPGPFMKHPKGIRDIAEWYMSTMMRPEYIHAIFEKQTQIALSNLQKFYQIAGNDIQAIFLCGTDFGTQDSQFCSTDSFRELYLPYYKRMNDWIHQNTSWKTFKHSCGAVEPLIQCFADAGFDILNPVQINAAGMDPKKLKEKYGEHIVFWGGGIDTQKILPFGTPAEVEKQVLQLCEIFGKKGGFVFNTIHNIQANLPVENVVSMINAVNKFNGRQ